MDSRRGESVSESALPGPMSASSSSEGLGLPGGPMDDPEKQAELASVLTQLIDESIREQGLISRAIGLLRELNPGPEAIGRIESHYRYLQHIRGEWLNLLTGVPIVSLAGTRLIEALRQGGWLIGDTGAREAREGVKGANQRRRSRYRLICHRVDHGLWEINSTDSQHFSAEVTDISESGVGLLVEIPLPLGALLQLPLMLGTMELIIKVRVRHCHKLAESGRYRVGGAFSYA